VLEAWLAGLQVDEATRSRARAAWLQRQAEEEANFVGVLVDLAERERVAVVETTSGRRHQGKLRVVGDDFCGLTTAQRRDVLVRYEAIVAIRPAPGEHGPSGDRLVAPVVTFVEAMAALAEFGARVHIVPIQGSPIAGDVRSVGVDVAVLQLDDRSRVHVRLASVGEVSVVESG
jgi:hypothetical protein